MDSSAPDELFLWDISHPYGPTGHRCVGGVEGESCALFMCAECEGEQ